MTHPMVLQLRFTRKEFLRGLKNVTDEEARKRFLPMNCISWNVGHLASQEQRYFLGFAGSEILYPDINRDFAFGAPASMPPLGEMLAAWKAITKAVDPFLDTLTPELLEKNAVSQGKPIQPKYGNMLQRVIYHYWFHNGENQAIRQMLGHTKLPTFVGSIDTSAPYVPEARAAAKLVRKSRGK